jgi:hypothetical protein
MPNNVCTASSTSSCGVGGDPCAVCMGAEQCIGGLCQ